MRGRMRCQVLGLGLALGCGGGEGRGSGGATLDLGSGGADGDDDGTTIAASSDEGDESVGASGAASGCPGECMPTALEEQPCPEGCGDQFRVCNDDCSWSPWSECAAAGGECTPGATQPCGTCMQQVCTEGCTWGACAAIECTYACLDNTSVRNGSEICDDNPFTMPDQPLFMYCVTGEGGVGYISNNTGPVQEDGVARCQGWEENGQNAWDFLDYIMMVDCTEAGLAVPVELPAGTNAFYGVHDQPEGGGHFTEFCVATMQ